MGFLEERDLSRLPSIPEFYNGKTIFITGGSGFMGKALVEKLLYSCPDLDRIYLLLRQKKGVKSDDRLTEVYESSCFDRLRVEKPDIFRKKVFCIAGDVMEDGLGLSEEDRTLLVNRVNIIFHVAASVRFDDTLSFATKLNLLGSKLVVDLAKEVRKLSVLVHVSTSYSNTNREVVEEVLYPPHADWRNTIDVCQNLDDNTLKIMTPKYLGELPNTYCFTKQLAEHMVYEQRGQLPIVIVRPSIVISSWEEPLPGWNENFNGPVGLTAACGKGLLRSIYSDPDLISDYIPVDTCIRSFIAAAWIRGTKKLEPSDDITIYNCCASNLNSMTMGEIVQNGMELTNEMPLNATLWYPGGTITKSKTVHYLKVLLLHLLPAILIDCILWLLGKKTLLVKVQRRIYIANIALHYYVTQQWTFSNDNFLALRSSVKDVDKEDFYYEIEGVDKIEYFRRACYGGKKYLFKETDDDLDKAKRNLKRMYYLDRSLKAVFYGYVGYILLTCSYTTALLNSLLAIF